MIYQDVLNLAAVDVAVDVAVAANSRSERRNSVPGRIEKDRHHDLRNYRPEPHADEVDHLMTPDPDELSLIDGDFRITLHAGA